MSYGESRGVTYLRTSVDKCRTLVERGATHPITGVHRVASGAPPSA